MSRPCGTSSAMTSSFPSPFCTLTTAALAGAASAPCTAARVCGGLGGDHAEVARGQLAAGGSRVDLRREVCESGDPQTLRLHRGHVLRPGVDGDAMLGAIEGWHPAARALVAGVDLDSIFVIPFGWPRCAPTTSADARERPCHPRPSRASLAP
jgi:hypothetical protein